MKKDLGKRILKSLETDNRWEPFDSNSIIGVKHPELPSIIVGSEIDIIHIVENPITPESKQVSFSWFIDRRICQLVRQRAKKDIWNWLRTQFKSLYTN